MKIVLATGIYPPDIGGPATYSAKLTKELTDMGHKVVVITYGVSSGERVAGSPIYVSKSGGPFLRWRRYRNVLRKHAADADVVYAFSSVSCALPLIFTGLRKPKKILRLGGDFFWERYTDRGGMKTLREWYEKKPLSRRFMQWLLNHLDHIVFSTQFQKEIYEKHYKKLPSHSVIENATPKTQPSSHEIHEPFRLLFMGRFVAFKNLPNLLRGIQNLQNTTLAIVGSGPMEETLQKLTKELKMENRVTFLPPVHGTEKRHIFDEHDLLVLPSITEISPNVALEARAAGLPVLLTQETGLTSGMFIRKLRSPDDIAKAIQEAMQKEQYEDVRHRTWQNLAEEHIQFFSSLIAHKKNLLMISGDRSLLKGKRSAFYYTLEELSKHWDRIDVICPRGSSYRTSPLGSARDDTLSVTPVFFGKVHIHPSPRGLWYQPWWILKKGKELNYSVMTVHSFPPFYNDIGAWFLSRSPYACEVHHITGHPKASSLQEWIGRWMTKLRFRISHARAASAVRVVNEEVKDILIKWRVPERKIHIVPSFYLDFEILKPNPNIKKEYDIVCVARLVENKGLEELLEAIAKVPNASLLLIGDGPLRKNIEDRISKIGIGDRVTLKGWLSTKEEVYHAIQSAKIFVMNSKSEGGPRSALEAMALGMPIITTRVGVMPNVITDGESGIFTDGSPQDLSEKIQELLGSEQKRTALAQRAPLRVNQFDRKRLIKQYADFLKEISL